MNDQITKCINCGSLVESTFQAEICSNCEIQLHKQKSSQKNSEPQLFGSITEVAEDNSNRNLAIIVSVCVGIGGVLFLAISGVKSGLIAAIPAVLAIILYKAIRNKS